MFMYFWVLSICAVLILQLYKIYPTNEGCHFIKGTTFYLLFFSCSLLLSFKALVTSSHSANFSYSTTDVFLEEEKKEKRT